MTEATPALVYLLARLWAWLRTTPTTRKADR